MWIDFVRYHAGRTPGRIALVLEETGERLSYAELDSRASFWASHLARRGITKGDRVAMLAENRLEHLTLFLGCAKIGAIFVPLNFRLSQREIEEQLAHIEPALFLGAGPRRHNGSGPYADLETLGRDGDREYPATKVAMDDTLLLLFTSGSTGKPKGVMLHAGMLEWNAVNTQTGWGLLPDDVSVVHMPFFHTGGYNVTCLPLLRLGGRLVLTGRFDPAKMLHTIAAEKVSVFFAVPTMFRMMMETPEFEKADLSSIRFCISGGAPCALGLIRAYRERGLPLKQGFGLTEVGPNCFCMSDEEARDRPDSVGRPMPNGRVELRDESGQPVADGAPGELCIQGPHVCKGYWRDPEAFAQVFRDGFFHTGDLMKRDAAGFYSVVGRRKEMYISGGENVYPGEVAAQLVCHPEVNDAVVLAVPHEKWGEVGFAFLRTRANLSLTEVRDFLNPRLSRYKHPHFLHCMEELPMLPNRKVDLGALREIALQEVGHAP